MSPRSWHSRLFTKTSQLCQFAGCHLFGGQMVGQAQARWAAKERSAPRDAPSSYACDPSQTLLESDGGPLRLLGSQGWDDRIFAVSDFLEVGAKIVGLVKNGLEVQGGVRIPRKERNRNDGQSILEADRVDEEVLGSVEPMDRHVVIERPRFGHGHLSRDSRRVNAAAKQVDFDQVGLALDDLALLRQVLLASRVAWALVGQAEDLDGRDQANILAFAPTDLHERLLERSVFDRLDRDDQGLGRKRLGDRDATATPPACFLT